MALQITNLNFSELVNSGKPTVVDFWAEWCGPCRVVSPIIDELAEEYEGRVNIGKVDVDGDGNEEVVGMFGIRNIPTVLFFKDGKLVDKVVGATTKENFRKKACHRSHFACGARHGGWAPEPHSCCKGRPHRPVPGS